MLKSETAIAALDSIDPDDEEQYEGPRWVHEDADDILLATVDPEVAAAYRRVVERCRWWAFA